jgi:hypothetical protein
MSIISFPTSPSINDTYSFNGKTWVFTGQGWNLATSGSINNVPIGNVTPATGNFTTVGATGNITTNQFFIGNGSQLSGITASGTLTVSNVAPVSPNSGDVWIAANTGVQFVYFTSGGNSQWAEMEADTSISSVSSGGGGNIDLTAVSSNIIPVANITYDIGNTSNRFRDIYLANSTIYLGNASISANGSNVVIASAVISSATMGNITNQSTGYMSLPVGNTAQRPVSAAAGMTRYNTTTGYPEFYDGNNWYNFYQQKTYIIQYLAVGGGGGGGETIGGGGGGGAVKTGNITAAAGDNPYTVTIGAGGAGGTDGAPSTYPGGASGNASSITSPSVLTVTAAGGGGGGGFNLAGVGTGGGQGGGAGASTGTGVAAGPGNYPGGTSGSNSNSGAGGGGAGAAGANSTSGSPGAGGIGYQWFNNDYYAGGGGGGARIPLGGTAAAGGLGGGGAGGTGGPATAGTTNTGGGGGGGGYTDSGTINGAGGAGGSGIVILRYEGSQKGSGGAVTSGNGYTYHTFISSGTYTP